ncbi:MAG: ketopantoate reductase family protein [Pseudoflavonifractor sp.]
MIKKIAIMGAGSLGTILGAYLAKAGRDVVLIDAYQAHVDALNATGAHVVGKVEMTVPVKAITPDQMEGVYDLFFYMAKQTFNDTAIPQMMAHMDENSIVCTCQNGLPERAVSKAIGKERTFGAPVGWGATFKGPGCSELTSSVMAFYLGTLDGTITEKLLETRDIMESMCPVHVSENLMGLRWTKLLVNCTFSGLSACFGVTFGEIMDNDKSMRLGIRLASECLKVAEAQGVKMEPHAQGGDLSKVFVWGDEATIANSMATVRKAWTPHRSLVASMAQDLAHGRKCEINAINGVTCESGDEVGIPTPVNDTVVKVVTAIQDGELKGSFDNLKYFEGLY